MGWISCASFDFLGPALAFGFAGAFFFGAGTAGEGTVGTTPSLSETTLSSPSPTSDALSSIGTSIADTVGVDSVDRTEWSGGLSAATGVDVPVGGAVTVFATFFLTGSLAVTPKISRASLSALTSRPSSDGGPGVNNLFELKYRNVPLVHVLYFNALPPIPTNVFSLIFHLLTASFLGKGPTSPPFNGANMGETLGNKVRLYFGGAIGCLNTGIPSLAASASMNGGEAARGGRGAYTSTCQRANIA